MKINVDQIFLITKTRFEFFGGNNSCFQICNFDRYYYKSLIHKLSPACNCK